MDALQAFAGWYYSSLVLRTGFRSAMGAFSKVGACRSNSRALICILNRLSGSEMDTHPKEPVSIPHSELSEDALRGVIESFVLREGTDYGEREFSLEQKVAHVLRQLRQGEARIVFDPRTGSTDIVRGPGK